MLAQKLFLTQKKEFTAKAPYKRPIYKSYKQLLHLDRPKKNIEYESSSQDEDFLQRLLNEQSKRSKQKKKRNKTPSSARRRPSQQKVRTDKIIKQQGKAIPQQSTEIKLIRDSSSREQSANKLKSKQLSLIQEERPEKQNDKPQTIAVKFKKQSQSTGLKPKGSIFIDTKSIQTIPIFYSSSNHLFHSTLPQKKHNAINLLIVQKNQYTSQYKSTSSSDIVINENRIEHSLNTIIEEKFKFAPSIKPINPNWRYNLTIPPIKKNQQRQFIDRKEQFRNKQQEERFVQSLRDLSRKKY